MRSLTRLLLPVASSAAFFIGAATGIAGKPAETIAVPTGRPLYIRSAMGPSLMATGMGETDWLRLNSGIFGTSAARQYALFQFQPAGDGTYFISHLLSGKHVIALPGVRGRAEVLALQHRAPAGDARCRFWVLPAGDGKFGLYNVAARAWVTLDSYNRGARARTTWSHLSHHRPWKRKCMFELVEMR